MTYTFFMGAIRHNEIENVKNTLEKFIDASASYIIAMETAPTTHEETQGEHMHFAVEMDDKQYDAFRHTCFNNHYKLRGKAVAGKARQYGKIKQVKDETRFLSYTVKDKNIVYRNIDLKTISDYIEKSHPKVEFRSLRTRCMEHLATISFEPIAGLTEHIQTQQIEKEVLRWLIDNDDSITKSTVKSMTRYYLIKQYPHTKRDFNEIYAYIMYN